MKFLRKNQIIIYSFVLMLMVAGYFNYTKNIGSNLDENTNSSTSIETSIEISSKSDELLADIGDAVLVSSDDVISVDDTDNSIEDSESDLDNDSIDGNITDLEAVDTNSTIVDNSYYFTESKLDRNNMYSEMLETYDNILNSTSSSETLKQTAMTEINNINDIKNMIMICENLIGLKGFDNCVVFVNNLNVSVVVEAETLDEISIVQIQNIISREMAVEIENITIQSK